MSNKKLVTLEAMQEFNEKKTKNIFVAEDGSTTITGPLFVAGSSVDQSKLLPDVDATANGKILQVVDGAWAVVTPTVIYVSAAEPTDEIGEEGDLYLQTD